MTFTDPFSRHRPQRNWGCRVRGLHLDGMPLVVVENERLRLAFLAGKGADLVEWLHKPDDLDLVWLAPGGIVNPATLPASAADPVGTFIDAYPGGWQTVFPNGGPPATVLGAAYGQHGEACLLPWDARVDRDDPEEVVVTFACRLRRMPFALERRVTLRAGEARFRIDETATNEGRQDLPAMWGQHVTFGAPFLTPACRVRVPDGIEVVPHPGPIHPAGRRVGTLEPTPWPTLPAEGGGTVDLSRVPDGTPPSEMLYLRGFGATGWYAVDNPERGCTARVAWDARTQPLCWYWQEFGQPAGWPWFGRARVIGLEPFAGWPTNGLADAIGNGSALTFAPGETKQTWIEASVEPMPGGGTG